MDRRNFNKNLMIAAGAGLPGLTAVAPKAAAEDSHRYYGLPPHDRVMLRTAGKTTSIARFLLLSEDGIHATNLRPALPQMAADRIDLGDVPLLGAVLMPTLRRQFRHAARLGTLYLVGHDIVLLPDRAAYALPGKKVWITHRRVVYQVPARLRRLRRAPTVTVRQARTAPVIGTAILQGNTILAVVPPSVLDDMQFEAPVPKWSDS